MDIYFIKQVNKSIITFLLFWIAQCSISMAQFPARQEAYNKNGHSQQPNIIIFLADDLGYADLGFYGHPEIKTPNLDQLANEGLKFENFYAAAANCSPSRAALLTGRTPYRVGIYTAIPMMSPMHLPLSEVTIASLLKRAGYTTAQFGKWHLNGLFNLPGQPQPNDHGFNYWFGVQNNALPNHKNPYNFVRNGIPQGPIEGYSGSIIAHNVIDWLHNHRNKSKPFFLYISFSEPHEPIATDSRFKALYEKKYPDDPSRVSYYGNVTQLDHAIGNILKELDSLDLAKKSLVLFTSDNGPATTKWHNAGSTGGLRGRKGELYEGGIRVPGIIRWPGHIQPGSVSTQPVSFVDVLPTLCQITGTNPPSDRTLDGVSILPLFTKETIKRREPLFWKFAFAINEGPQVAMRKREWKLLAKLEGPRASLAPRFTEAEMKLIKHAGLTDFELYNLNKDPDESTNLIAKRPDKLAKLKAEMEKINAEVRFESPIWPPFNYSGYERERIEWPDYVAQPLSEEEK